MNKYVPAVIILIAIAYWLYPASTPAPPPPAPTQVQMQAPQAEPLDEPEIPTPTPKPVKITQTPESEDENPMALPYRIIDGLIVVQGDIVAGAVPEGESIDENGHVQMDPVKLWPNVIPYHIQPDVENPERILEALKMFEGTAVRFIKHTNEDYALVFERGTQNCLSYIGRVVDKQPVWISPQCTPDNIAHEVLHALGFAHEQNRTDRDNFISVNFDNIEDEFTHNFAKLPKDFMLVSGLTDFDFQSLMLYPPWMFAKGGRSTMEPKMRDNLIRPGAQLSEKDILRLNRAYSTKN